MINYGKILSIEREIEIKKQADHKMKSDKAWKILSKTRKIAKQSSWIISDEAKIQKTNDFFLGLSNLKSIALFGSMIFSHFFR